MSKRIFTSACSPSSGGVGEKDVLPRLLLLGGGGHQVQQGKNWEILLTGRAGQPLLHPP